jgi:hypothetical protein
MADTKSLPAPISRAHLSWQDRLVGLVAGGLLVFLAWETYNGVKDLTGRVSRLEGVVEVLRSK